MIIQFLDLDKIPQYNYKLYSIILSLPFEVDFLEPSKSNPDIYCYFDWDLECPSNYAQKDIWSTSNLRDAFYFNKEVGIFYIKEGSEIRFRPNGNKISNEELIKNLLFTPMALIFLQRKLLVLHGSSISIRDKAYVFCGPSGSGKSTIVYELLKYGHKFISEDVSVLKNKKLNTYIAPSFPIIKLDRSLYKSKEIIGRKIENVRKDHRNRSLYTMNENLFQRDEQKIRSCYLIMGFKDKEVEPLKADSNLLKNIYTNIWRQVPHNSSIDTEKLVLKEISNFISTVEFYGLWISKDPSTSAKRVLNHIQS